MIGRVVVVVFISLVIADLANSFPKLGKKPAQKYEPGKKSARQGLPASVEDLQEGDPNGKGEPVIFTESSEPTGSADIASDEGEENAEAAVNSDPDKVPDDDQENAGETGTGDANGTPNVGIKNAEGTENGNIDVTSDEGQESLKHAEDNSGYDNPGDPNMDDDTGDIYIKEDELPVALKSHLAAELANQPYETRALQAGDVFTVQEILPIAAKLMTKVHPKSKGKGIISSAYNPKILADILFERFFLSLKRIVVLEDIDIPGLDALQALAISGDAVELRSSVNSITESPFNKRGEQLLEENPIRKCHYKFLRKRVYRKRNQNVKRGQRGYLKSKLQKNRKVVINAGRRDTARKNKMSRNRIPKRSKYIRSKNGNLKQNQNRIPNGKIKRGSVRSNKVGPKLNNSCRWKYECTDEIRLESCRVHVDCSEEARSGRRYVGVKLSYDEYTDELKNFRRKIGVDVIDEEVEKILEVRYKTLRVEKPQMDKNIESLSDYFNKLVVRENNNEVYSSHHPMAAGAKSDMVTEAYSPDENDKPQNEGSDDGTGPDEDVQNLAGAQQAGDETVAPEDEKEVAVIVDLAKAPREEAQATEDEPGEGGSASVLEAKRRILPGLRPNSARVLPINA